MSERISVVVPDGTIERLKNAATEERRSQSNLTRKFILDGLNGVSVLPVILKGEDLLIDIKRNGGI